MKQYETTTRTVFENRVQIDEHTKGELVKYVNHHHWSEQTKKLQKWSSFSMAGISLYGFGCFDCL